MLYDIYQRVCILIIRVLNMRVPWSGSIQPTIAQVIVFTCSYIDCQVYKGAVRMTVDTTEIYEAVPDTELIENSEVLNAQGEESISQGVKEDNTETVTIDNSSPAVGSTVQTVDYASNLDSISNDVHIIMFIVVFSFCWSCMKSWRTHSLKGVIK